MKIKNKKIEFKFNGIEFGIHDGFFNGIAIVDGKKYYFQCCVEKDGSIDPSNSGYDWGICGEVNQHLADVIDWENFPELLEEAYIQYSEEYEI